MKEIKKAVASIKGRDADVKKALTLIVAELDKLSKKPATKKKVTKKDDSAGSKG